VVAFVVLVGAVIGGSILVNHHSKTPARVTIGTLVSGPGFSIRVPDGWERVPRTATALHGFVASLAKVSPDAAAELVSVSTTPLAKRFGLYVIRPSTAPVLISISLLTGEGGGRSVASLATAARLQLSSIGATGVVTRATRVFAGPAVFVTYRLVAHAGGRSIAVEGAQYYIVSSRGVAILSLTTVDRAADELAFDQMAGSFSPA
jgi:hypothetical protein